MSASDRTGMPQPETFDAVVVGAGFSGLYMLHRLRGLGLRAVVFEAGEDVGGTWYWNRYPGARCDIESMQYSFSFSDDLQQEWSWGERYAAQPEILRYAGHVADRFDLRRDIRFATRVVSAHYGDRTGRWTVRTDRGETIDCRLCIMATGCLSTGRIPDFPGLEDFNGATYHTGSWPHAGVDFTGQRVAVVGTGSSAIQSIPVIAAQAAHVTVFQRTPNFSIPSRNGPMTAEYEHEWKSEYAARREEARHARAGLLHEAPMHSALEVDDEERARIYQRRWQAGGTNFTRAFNDLLVSKSANDTAATFVRDRIREIVADPATAATLAPTNHPIGTKRICVDTDYYATFNRPNVSLVDIRQHPIAAIAETGIVAGGNLHEVDSIVFATGFDAMTGSLLRMDLRGRRGERLADKWEAGPRTLLGLMTAGFPNMFTITGPGSPSVLSNMMVSIEQHVDWIADCLATMAARGMSTIEPSVAAENDWGAHVNEAAHKTLYPQANSWYMGANIPGKPRVFMPYIGGVGAYRDICDEVAADGYRGFVLSGAAETRSVAAE